MSRADELVRRAAPNPAPLNTGYAAQPALRRAHKRRTWWCLLRRDLVLCVYPKSLVVEVDAEGAELHRAIDEQSIANLGRKVTCWSRKGAAHCGLLVGVQLLDTWREQRYRVELHHGALFAGDAFCMAVRV